MTPTYDIAIVGLGVMGLCAAHRAVGQGLRVIGFDQHSAAHDLGSSHGATRIIRKAYFEHPDYVPLLEIAYRNWARLEQDCRTKMFERTGIVIFGRKEQSPVLAGIRKSADDHELTVEFMTGDAAIERFPQFHLEDPESWSAAFEADAGYLNVEPTLRVLWQRCRELGGELREGSRVDDIELKEDGVVVHADGATIHAKKLILTAGPWSNSVLSKLGIHWPLAVHRTTLFWHPCQSWFTQKNGMPCFGFDVPEGFFYGFPAIDELGLKVALHKPLDRVARPEDVVRDVADDDSMETRRLVGAFLQGVDTAPAIGKTCLYTMTPDERFIVDFHPSFRHCVVACGFSGHGFKFGAAIGEVALGMAMSAQYTEQARFLSAERFVQGEDA